MTCLSRHTVSESAFPGVHDCAFHDVIFRQIRSGENVWHQPKTKHMETLSRMFIQTFSRKVLILLGSPVQQALYEKSKMLLIVSTFLLLQTSNSNLVV
jgi:hypothetical protein